ncbi:type I restriction endonuclease subunit R [Microcoleus sp. FACHB-SPT15]|uniref:type I restriction endonuclease n=1 Tax=Microcoleus sp. FACHB-SPT15 TaxID=2692830 RepID=UPI00177D12FC|nr:type I restriction endonuclease [Microcoleus sp. FACHB-SPT15]MBD1803907.1 type I restriction endonuclease subunit R [Microcoleus sp. FACHB-SPT15]
MVKTLQAKNLSLYDLEKKFNLTLAEDEQFFTEWREDLPAITDSQKQALDRIKANYLNLNRRRPMLEDMVKMVVLSPLLDLADFYNQDFDIQTEAEVEIFLEDEDEIIKGYIDVLTLKDDLWILVIESKRTQVDVMSALSQLLFYMLNNPNPVQETFGLMTNGREFVFIKLTQQETPKYAYSKAFDIQTRENELYSVLSILKRLGSRVSR